MARKQNKSPNSVLKYKPNQFPGARFGNIRWEKKPITESEDVGGTTESESGTTTEVPNERLEYLRNRFKSGTSNGSVGA